MCAHHNVHGAIGQTLERFSHFFARAEARHFGHLHGPLRETIFQGLKVLFCQQGGGRQDGHLFATRDGHKGGTQSHFGFSKAHIAAHQAIHGAWADHVLNDRMNGGILIGCFLKAKVIGKDFVILRAVSKGVAFARSTPCINVQQLGGRIAHLLGRFAFGFFPLATAQAVQRGFVGTDTGVAANQLQLANGHIQRSLVGIFQVQKFL